MNGGPLDTRPRSVALVALGPSYRDFVGSRINKKSSQRYDEIWVVNSGLEVFKADKIWLMDDLRVMQHRYPAWGERMKSEKTPIVTCREYPEYPSAVAYPLEDVMRCVQDDWFTNTVAYAIGYAILTQVEELYIFGADFMYPGNHVVEPGADCCSYLLGLATGKGVRWKLPMSTTLMDSHLCQADKDGKLSRPLYGYDYNPGDCRSKVEAGTATELEKILARKAPHKVQEISNGPQAQDYRMGEGQPHGTTRGGQTAPNVDPRHAGSIRRTPAGRPDVLRGRDGDHQPAAVGARPDAAAWPRPSAPTRVDGTGDGIERIELALTGNRGERTVGHA